ncbi:MAG: class I SAM-dependent methyltransferase [Nitrospinota bacterium]|nr:class I SAM-dependent methyltransferase [Nitrospinota bacterium]
MSVWTDEEQARFFLTTVRASLPLIESMTDLAFRLIESHVPQPATVIDIGCGAGALGGEALRRWPGAGCLFVDFSSPMMDQCHKALESLGDRADFLCDDFSHPQWASDAGKRGPFDVALSGFAIHHQPDERKREIYKEIFGMLRPGGVFMHLEHVAPLADQTSELFVTLFRENLFERARLSGVDVDKAAIIEALEKRAHKDENRLASVEDQCQWLRDVGFDDVDVYFKITELALFGGVRPG